MSTPPEADPLVAVIETMSDNLASLDARLGRVENQLDRIQFLLTSQYPDHK
jgi:hypothetical protein